MNFSENLRRLRLQQNISQKQLADRLEVSINSIGNWERGVTTPFFVNSLIALADILDTSLDDLVGIPKTKEKSNSPYPEILDKYEELDEFGKAAVDSVCDIEYRRVKQSKENSSKQRASVSKKNI